MLLIYSWQTEQTRHREDPLTAVNKQATEPEMPPRSNYSFVAHKMGLSSGFCSPLKLSIDSNLPGKSFFCLGCAARVPRGTGSCSGLIQLLQARSGTGSLCTPRWSDVASLFHGWFYDETAQLGAEGNAEPVKEERAVPQGSKPVVKGGRSPSSQPLQRVILFPFSVRGGSWKEGCLPGCFRLTAAEVEQ